MAVVMQEENKPNYFSLSQNILRMAVQSISFSETSGFAGEG